MEFLEIVGPTHLRGSTKLCGAKNSILPLLAASLLTEGTSVFTNVPNLTDVALACAILKELGIVFHRDTDRIEIEGSQPSADGIPSDLMEGMRGSFIFLGSLLARNGCATVFTPGGCKLGTRPVDIHIAALSAMGATFATEGHRLTARIPSGKLQGAEIALRFPSVGATENVLLAAATAQGTTKIVNAAREPEIVDLAQYLNRCGADIRGAGERMIVINGVDGLHGTEYRVVPDRILAATLFSAAAITHSAIELQDVSMQDLGAIISVYTACGLNIQSGVGGVLVDGSGEIRCIPRMVCAPHPGFPTDAGPLLAALLCLGNGKSEIYDTVFENRFQCSTEMQKLGADTAVVGRSIIINKVCKPLRGTHVTARDLRGGAALVNMALGSLGTTTLFGVEHIDRGYSAIEKTLRSLGARIHRKAI